MPTFKIPYESLDPLTIGSADDESKVYRDELELEIAEANLLAAIYPDEPDHLPDATAAAAEALESPVEGPRFSELIAGGKSVAIVIDNQFRPTPQSKLLPAVLDALEAAGTTDAVVICANGKVFPMSESDIEHEARPRQPRAAGADGDPVPPERAAQRRGVHLRRRLLARHARLAAQGGRRSATSRSRSARRSRITGARAAAAS